MRRGRVELSGVIELLPISSGVVDIQTFTFVKQIELYTLEVRILLGVLGVNYIRINARENMD